MVTYLTNTRISMNLSMWRQSSTKKHTHESMYHHKLHFLSANCFISIEYILTRNLADLFKISLSFISNFKTLYFILLTL